MNYLTLNLPLLFKWLNSATYGWHSVNLQIVLLYSQSNIRVVTWWKGPASVGLTATAEYIGIMMADFRGDDGGYGVGWKSVGSRHSVDVANSSRFVNEYSVRLPKCSFHLAISDVWRACRTTGSYQPSRTFPIAFYRNTKSGNLFIAFLLSFFEHTTHQVHLLRLFRTCIGWNCRNERVFNFSILMPYLSCLPAIFSK